MAPYACVQPVARSCPGLFHGVNNQTCVTGVGCVPYTPTPSPPPTPTRVLPQSVCGGAITSVPKVCSLTSHDAGVFGNERYLNFSFCYSDLEGDINEICVGAAVDGSSSEIDCAYVPPSYVTANTCTDTGPIAVGPIGEVHLFLVALALGDTAGNVSNVASTTFTCCQ